MSSPTLPLPVRRTEDGVGIAEAVRTRLYRTRLTKESKKCWERVTHVHPSTARAPYGAKELTMTPSKRYVENRAKVRQRQWLKAHARLQRDQQQAQRAAEVLH